MLKSKYFTFDLLFYRLYYTGGCFQINECYNVSGKLISVDYDSNCMLLVFVVDCVCHFCVYVALCSTKFLWEYFG